MVEAAIWHSIIPTDGPWQAEKKAIPFVGEGTGSPTFPPERTKRESKRVREKERIKGRRKTEQTQSLLTS